MHKRIFFRVRVATLLLTSCFTMFTAASLHAQFPKQLQELLSKAQAKQAANDYEGAIAILDEVIRIEPRKAIFYAHRAMLKAGWSAGSRNKRL